MNDPSLLVWFRRAVTRLVTEAERGHGAVVQRRSWMAAGAAPYATEKAFDPSPIEVMSHLPSASPDNLALANDFLEFAHTLPWQPSGRVDDGGATVGLVDLFECIDIDLAGAGVLLLAPGAGYPEHQHRPAEVYLVLHGSRRWRFGGSDRYLKVDSGQVLSNSSFDVHGIEPGDEPLIALWVLMDDR